MGDQLALYPHDEERERSAVRAAITYRLAGLTLHELRQVATLADMLEQERRALEAIDPRTPGAGL